VSQSPDQLQEAARVCRDLAAGCLTEEARSAFLEVADGLAREAGINAQAEEHRERHTPLFNWTKP
jgi:hypothetical protein